jgi:hypothetical protein
MRYTDLSEILVTRVCGGSKIAEIQEIQKMLGPVTNTSTTVDIVSMSC